MTTTIVYSETTTSAMFAYHSTYAGARRGNQGDGWKVSFDDPNTFDVGQYYNGTDTYYCYEAFLDFDTSSIPDSDVIDSAVLSLYDYYGGYLGTHFTVQARAFDWGGQPIEKADYRSGDPADSGSLDEYTLLATYNTTSGWGAGVQYRVFTSESAFVSNINKTGATRIVLNSSRHLAGNTPTGNERIVAYGDETAGRYPRLVIEHHSTFDPPANLDAAKASPTQINLSWDDATDADYYDIERDAEIIESLYTGTHTPGSPYQDTDLDPTTEYDYRVRSVKDV